MTLMNISIFKPFTEWATPLAKAVQEDALIRARLRTALLFMGFCTISFFVVGYIVDGITRDLFAALAQGVLSSEEVVARIEQVRWMARAFHIALIGVAIYLLMGLSFRPVRQAIEAQRRFMAKAAHELRTPLAIAKTEIEVALRSRTALTKEEAVAQLESTLVRVDHVSRTIQFLLVLSDLSSPGAHSFTRPVFLSAVVRACHARYQEDANLKQISLTVRTSVAWILGNAVALEKLVNNLLRNALAYTPPEGEVRIAVDKQKEKIHLVVEDTGPGIPPEERTKVLEPFYRAKNALPGGSGVGLAIVQEIARLHRSRISITSSAEGGARVEVVFPIHRLSPLP